MFVKIFVLSSGSLLGHHLLFFFLLLLIKSWSEKKKERKGYVYEKYVMVVALQLAAGSDGPNKGRKQDENDLLAPEQTKKKREHRPVKTTCRRGAWYCRRRVVNCSSHSHVVMLDFCLKKLQPIWRNHLLLHHTTPQFPISEKKKQLVAFCLLLVNVHCSALLGDEIMNVFDKNPLFPSCPDKRRTLIE